MADDTGFDELKKLSPEELTRHFREEQQDLRETYGWLYDQVLDILDKHDPVGIAFVAPDEYAPEAKTILLRLGDAESQEEVRRIAHEEFVRWFDHVDVGPESNYDQIARDIWTALLRYRSENVS